MTGNRVAVLMTMCVLVVTHPKNVCAETLECKLLKEKILNLAKDPRQNSCDRDYEICMLTARDTTSQAYCPLTRNACEAGRQLNQALSNKEGRLREMIAAYKANCE